MSVFMNATTKLVTCTILVSFIYIWSHVEDFIVLYVSIKLFITEEHPMNYRKSKKYVPEKAE